MMTGHEFLQLANRWCALPPPQGTEALWRTSISRAYYGAFHLARDLLVEIGIVFPRSAEKRDEHGFVRNALRNSGHESAARASGLLTDLHGCRKDADYRLQQKEFGTQERARTCVEIAQQIRTHLSTCGPTCHPEMLAAIQSWQRTIRMI